MLPKNKLGAKLQTNVFIYEGTKHPHEAQQPKELKFN
jgi:large subunit ribosomal protein L13